MNRDQLLEIYHLVYQHYVESILRDNRFDKNDSIEDIIDVTQFGNMIATDPYSENTQTTAERYKTTITAHHTKILDSLKKAEPVEDSCICLQDEIKQLISTTGEQVDYYDNASDNNQSCFSLFEKYNHYVKEYDRFLDYERKFNQLYNIDN